MWIRPSTLWNTISSRRGCLLSRPVVVMSMVWPCSNATLMASSVAAMHMVLSAGRRLYSLADVAEGAPLAARGVEVLGRKPGFEGRSSDWPLLIGDRVPGRIAVAAFDDHVPAKHTFEREPKPFRRAARREVERIALPLETAVAQVVERMAGPEVDGLGRLARPLQPRREQEMPHLDHTVLRDHAHQAALSERHARGAIHNRVEQGILRSRALRDPLVEGFRAAKWSVWQVLPELVRTFYRGVHLIRVTARIQSFQSDGVALDRRPVRHLGSAPLDRAHPGRYCGRSSAGPTGQEKPPEKLPALGDLVDGRAPALVDVADPVEHERARPRDHERDHDHVSRVQQDVGRRDRAVNPAVQAQDLDQDLRQLDDTDEKRDEHRERCHGEVVEDLANRARECP